MAPKKKAAKAAKRQRTASPSEGPAHSTRTLRSRSKTPGAAAPAPAPAPARTRRGASKQASTEPVVEIKGHAGRATRASRRLGNASPLATGLDGRKTRARASSRASVTEEEMQSQIAASIAPLDEAEDTHNEVDPSATSDSPPEEVHPSIEEDEPARQQVTVIEVIEVTTNATTSEAEAEAEVETEVEADADAQMEAEIPVEAEVRVEAESQLQAEVETEAEAADTPYATDEGNTPMQIDVTEDSPQCEVVGAEDLTQDEVVEVEDLTQVEVAEVEAPTTEPERPQIRGSVLPRPGNDAVSPPPASDNGWIVKDIHIGNNTFRNKTPQERLAYYEKAYPRLYAERDQLYDELSAMNMQLIAQERKLEIANKRMFYWRNQVKEQSLTTTGNNDRATQVAFPTSILNTEQNRYVDSTNEPTAEYTAVPNDPELAALLHPQPITDFAARIRQIQGPDILYPEQIRKRREQVAAKAARGEQLTDQEQAMISEMKAERFAKNLAETPGSFDSSESDLAPISELVRVRLRYCNSKYSCYFTDNYRSTTLPLKPQRLLRLQRLALEASLLDLYRLFPQSNYGVTCAETIRRRLRR